MPLIYSAGFIIKQKVTQHRAKEKLEESLLQKIVLKENDFTWVKKDKEIYISGKLFDIKSYELKNDCYEFTGLFDEEEDALNKKLSNGINQQNKLLLSSLFQLLLTASSKNSFELIISNNTSVTYFPLILEHISFPFQDIPTPPPQV